MKESDFNSNFDKFKILPLEKKLDWLRKTFGDDEVVQIMLSFIIMSLEVLKKNSVPPCKDFCSFVELGKKVKFSNSKDKHISALVDHIYTCNHSVCRGYRTFLVENGFDKLCKSRGIIKNISDFGDTSKLI